MKNQIHINKLVFVITLSLIMLACSSGEQHLNKEFKTLISQSERELGLIDTTRLKDLAKDHVIRASNLQQMNRYADAILEFQDALQYDSSSVIFSAIGNCYLQLGRYEQALSSALKALKIDSLNIPAMDVLYQYYSYRLKLENAITIYTQIVKLEPTYFRKLTLARLYELQDKDKAIAIYEEILDEGENEDIMLRLSELYKAKGNYEKYMNLTLKITENKANRFPILSNLVEAFYLNKKYEDAYKVVDKADENLVEDDLTGFYLKYGDLLFLDSSSESKSYIHKFLPRIDQRFFSRWSIYYLGGFLSDKIKDTSMTDKFFSKTLDFIDTNQEIPIDIGMVYYNNKRYIKALEIFSKFETNFPDNYLYPFYIGTVYAAMDSNLKALGPLNRALDLEEKNVIVLGQLGLVYNNLKEFIKSDSIYELALEVNPGDALINNNYAYSLSDRGIKLDEALRMTEIALTADSNNSSYLDTYGWIAYKLGDNQKALEFINKSISTGKASAEVYEHLGDVQLKMGDKTSAIESYEKSLGLDIESHGNASLRLQLKLDNIRK